jgi:hypothetical protein
MELTKKADGYEEVANLCRRMNSEVLKDVLWELWINRRSGLRAESLRVLTGHKLSTLRYAIRELNSRYRVKINSEFVGGWQVYKLEQVGDVSWE